MIDRNFLRFFKMPYNRPLMSFADQLQQLVDRGLEVTDSASAISYLDRIGYLSLIHI